MRFTVGSRQKNLKCSKKQVLFYADGHCDELLIYVVDNAGTGYSITLKGSGGSARIKGVTREQ